MAPWNVIRLVKSLPPCRSERTCTVSSPRLSIFSPPGPTYRCPFTEPFDGFKSIFGQSFGFTTDSVISRYRPRFPSGTTGLLSMDILPIVTAFKSTSSGHHSPSLELSLGRSFTFTGDVTLWRFHLQTLVHSQLLAHRKSREVY